MERRWNERKPVQLNAIINSNSSMITGHTENIGMGGLFLNIAPGIHISNNQAVQVSLENDSHEVSVKTTVVRVEDGGIAVKFNDYPPRLLSMLKQFINEEDNVSLH
jgi:hypothetical protein